jgi:hypothetical protein
MAREKPACLVEHLAGHAHHGRHAHVDDGER